MDKSPAIIQCEQRVKSVWGEAVEAYQIRQRCDLILSFVTNTTMHKQRKCNSSGCGSVIFRGVKRPLVIVKLNLLAIQQNLTAVLGDTIPHEVAHVVCALRPQHGDKHDHRWYMTCKRLGGSGLAYYPAGMFDLEG